VACAHAEAGRSVSSCLSRAAFIAR
jgi:hypothetical protein